MFNLADSVVAIVVTYGDRWNFLSSVLLAAQNNGIQRVVVVDNLSKYNVKLMCDQYYPGLCNVIEMTSNTGSAYGFSVGMKYATENFNGYILLLDDDNELQDNCVSQLLAELGILYQKGFSKGKSAVLAFRPDHQADIASGLHHKFVTPRINSFLGFNALDIPIKLFKRTKIGRKNIFSGDLQKTYNLQVAPWSGLLFSVDLIREHGLPRSDFVLYADDTEYTWRVTSSGGIINLVTASKINDLDSSWNIKKKSSNSFSGYIGGVGDFRIYYALRNQIFFEKNYYASSYFWYFNALIYLVMLMIVGIFRWRISRCFLIIKAVRDGFAGRLGQAAAFKL